MSTLLTNITEYLLNQSVHIAVLFVLITMACLTLRNKSAHVRYLLWLLILAKCLIPSLLTISLAVLPESPAPTTETIIPEIIETVYIPAATPVTNIEVAPPAIYISPTFMYHLRDLSVAQWFALSWIAGTIIVMLFVMLKALRTNSILQKNRKPLPQRLCIEINELLADLAGSNPKCYCIDDIAQPFVWGLLKGSIYLPTDFAKHTDASHRRQVIMHELSHITRKDPIVNLLQIIAQAVFFFHPLVWIANRIIRAEREKCCDEAAIAKLNASPRDYGKAIVDTLVNEYKSTMPTPSMAIAGPVKNIENRIKTIMQPNRKFYQRPTVIALSMIMLVAAVALPTGFALTERNSRLGTVIAESEKFAITEIDFEPIAQGKNTVWITVKNKTNKKQFFHANVYSRSVDFGPDGIGWGTGFYEKFEAGQAKSLRYVYKIQGPITNNTYTRLTFYNAISLNHDENKGLPSFAKKQYTMDKLEVYVPQGKMLLARGEDFAIASKLFTKAQQYIGDSDYKKAWNLFTEDHKKAEYQVRGFEAFKKQMEPKHILDDAFTWRRQDFLKLKPLRVSGRDNKLTLDVTAEDSLWKVDFVKQNGQWKIDWIAGYTPAVIGIQEDNKPQAKQIDLPGGMGGFQPSEGYQMQKKIQMSKRLNSAVKMKRLGSAMHVYTFDNNGIYPDQLNKAFADLVDLAYDEWLANDVVFLAAGEKEKPAQEVIAYDKSILKNMALGYPRLM